jgi:hypothetical protein
MDEEKKIAAIEKWLQIADKPLSVKEENKKRQNKRRRTKKLGK